MLPASVASNAARPAIAAPPRDQAPRICADAFLSHHRLRSFTRNHSAHERRPHSRPPSADRTGFRTSLCFTIDNGSLTSCEKHDAVGGDRLHRAIHQLLAGAHDERLRAGALNHRDEAAAIADDALDRDFRDQQPGQPRRPRRGAPAGRCRARAG